MFYIDEISKERCTEKVINLGEDPVKTTCDESSDVSGRCLFLIQ